MSDPKQMLERQAQWQKHRQSLTWPEKLRLAERVLESVRQWRSRPSPAIRGPADHVRNGTTGQRDCGPRTTDKGLRTTDHV